RLSFVSNGSRVGQLIADLDHEVFAIREAASQTLKQMGDLAEPSLRKALDNGPSPEVRRRLEQLQDGLEPPDAFVKRRRALPAIEVLEAVGTPEARRALEQIHEAAPGSWLRKEAKAALERLARRQ